MSKRPGPGESVKGPAPKTLFATSNFRSIGCPNCKGYGRFWSNYHENNVICWVCCT